MTKTKLVLLIAAGLSLASPIAVNAATDLSETRNTLKEWVELRKLISEESADWKVEKETLNESIELLESEIDNLKAQIADKEAAASTADEQRQLLNDQETELKNSAAVVGRVISDMEAEAIAMTKMFPNSLTTKLLPITGRIPKDEKSAKALSLSARVQNIVAILIEVEKFNGAVTLESTMQQINGENVAVKTLYLGFGAAYYVDGTGTEAGVLSPSADGWVKESRNELAKPIAKAIAIYEREATPEFVNLPIKIK